MVILTPCETAAGVVGIHLVPVVHFWVSKTVLHSSPISLFSLVYIQKLHHLDLSARHSHSVPALCFNSVFLPSAHSFSLSFFFILHLTFCSHKTSRLPFEFLPTVLVREGESFSLQNSICGEVLFYLLKTQTYFFYIEAFLVYCMNVRG